MEQESYKESGLVDSGSIIFKVCSAMGSHAISVLCLVLAVTQIAFCEVWEFGKANTPGSLRIVRKEGRMGLFEHNKKIKLAVSNMVFKYLQTLELVNSFVRVAVEFLL